MSRVAFSTLVAVLLTSWSAGAAYAAVTCTAVAPAPKSETTAAHPAVGHAAPYSVRLTASGAMVVVSVEPKSTAAATHGSGADVAKVLLRSPYKTEATALPSEVHANGSAAVATFDAAALRALPAGPFNVVITTAYGERSCRITQHQRTQLVHSE